MSRRCVGAFTVLAACTMSTLPACGGATPSSNSPTASLQDATSSSQSTETTSPISNEPQAREQSRDQRESAPIATTPETNTASAPPGGGAADLTVETAIDPSVPRTVEQFAAFPLTVSSDGETLVDQNDAPFLVIGDAAWSMIVQLDPAETDEYLARRRQQGFNTLVVNLIEHRFSDDPPNNAFGEPPFLADGDFARPNPAYFDAARQALDRAAAAGFLVLLTPAYLGYEGGDEGWYRAMVAAGPEVLREYGRFVGEQFGDLDNVIWVQGGDFTIPEDDLDLVEAVRDGIVETGSTQLHTAHWSPEASASDVDVDWLDLNTTYTYGPVHVASRADDDVVGVPHVMFESQYEADQFDDVTTQRLRSQAYEAVLTGAIGSVYGHGDVWQFSSNWRAALDADGAGDMTHAAALFQSMPWFALDPTAPGDIVAEQGDPGRGRLRHRGRHGGSIDDRGVSAARPRPATRPRGVRRNGGGDVVRPDERNLGPSDRCAR